MKRILSAAAMALVVVFMCCSVQKETRMFGCRALGEGSFVAYSFLMRTGAPFAIDSLRILSSEESDVAPGVRDGASSARGLFSRHRGRLLSVASNAMVGDSVYFKTGVHLLVPTDSMYGWDTYDFRGKASQGSINGIMLRQRNEPIFHRSSEYSFAITFEPSVR